MTSLRSHRGHLSQWGVEQDSQQTHRSNRLVIGNSRLILGNGHRLYNLANVEQDSGELCTGSQRPCH